MPADPETMAAIHALGENLRNAIDGRLNAHKEESDRARQRIYDRIDRHADESRSQLAEASAEFRGAIQAVGVQVATVATELRAHTAHDDERFRRQDREIEAARAANARGAEDRGRMWRMLAWLVGATGIGTGLLSKWGGGSS